VRGVPYLNQVKNNGKAVTDVLGGPYFITYSTDPYDSTVTWVYNPRGEAHATNSDNVKVYVNDSVAEWVECTYYYKTDMKKIKLPPKTVMVVPQEKCYSGTIWLRCKEIAESSANPQGGMGGILSIPVLFTYENLPIRIKIEGRSNGNASTMNAITGTNGTRNTKYAALRSSGTNWILETTNDAEFTMSLEVLEKDKYPGAAYFKYSVSDYNFYLFEHTKKEGFNIENKIFEIKLDTDSYNRVKNGERNNIVNVNTGRSNTAGISQGVFIIGTMNVRYVLFPQIADGIRRVINANNNDGTKGWEGSSMSNYKQMDMMVFMEYFK